MIKLPARSYEGARRRPSRPGGKGRFARPVAFAVVITTALSVITIMTRLGEGTRADPSDGSAGGSTKDVERKVGQTAKVGGYRVTVTRAGFQQQFNQFEGDGYLVANVSIVNESAPHDGYNTRELWSVTPERTMLNGTSRVALGGLKQLYRSNLKKGSSLAGQVVWQVGAQRGLFSIVFRPPGEHQAGAVWKVRV